MRHLGVNNREGHEWYKYEYYAIVPITNKGDAKIGTVGKSHDKDHESGNANCNCI